MSGLDRALIWRRWVLVGAVVVVGVGAALVLLALVGVPAGLMELLYAPGEPDVASATTLSFAIGVTGAVMVGWGASLFYAYLDPAMVDQPRVAWAFLVGTVAWFVLDTALSLALGATLNALGNVLLLGLLMPPLVALARRA